jgi:high affinity sulfate transporter 1
MTANASAAALPDRIRSFYAHRFKREWLGKDIVAGLVLASLLVPQGMAYAQLAGLPPITGLYTSITCLVAYALVGPSRLLVLGPDSALGGMIAATVLPLVAASGDPNKAVIYASAMSLMVGALMIVGARVGLGFIADLLSNPIQVGYINGLALVIFVGQLPKLFGFSTDASGFINETIAFVRGVVDGQTVPAALAIGLFSVALMLLLARFIPRVPGVLIAVIAAMVIAVVIDAAARGVQLVGVLPAGLPRPSLPVPALTDIPLLAAGAFGIAVVSLADTITISSAFAARTGQEVKANREMIGIGAADLAAGFFSGFPVSTSASRTAVAEGAGSKSQVTGLVGALVIALMLVFLPGLFQFLPQPTLAAVVIVASFGLVDIRATVRLYRQRPTEFALLVVAFLGVVLLGVLAGIAVAVGLSILLVFRRVWSPYRTLLGDVPGVPGFHDVSMYDNAVQIPGLVIYRFDAPLIFANASTFREEVREFAHATPKPRWIVIAAEPMIGIDTTAADMLEELDDELEAEGIQLMFAELKDVVRHDIKSYRTDWLTHDDRFFPTVRTAARAYAELYPDAAREAGVEL